MEKEIENLEENIHEEITSEKSDKAKKAIRIIGGLLVISIVILAGIYFYYYYQIDSDYNVKDEMHKKAFFDNTLCQYSCQVFDKELPDGGVVSGPSVDCLKECLANFEDRIEAGYTRDRKLLDDPLFRDVQEVIVSCREISSEGETVDNNKMFGCVPGRLEELKTSYPYLV